MFLVKILTLKVKVLQNEKIMLKVSDVSMKEDDEWDTDVTMDAAEDLPLQSWSSTLQERGVKEG